MTASVATPHPSLGVLLAAVSIVGSILSAFHASTSGTRATVLAQAATAP